jgi:diadenosine tetraphosphate (Ap4A) HIT family hydrolase
LSGQLIAHADGFLIYHAMTDEEGRSPLGYLFIESERHTPYLWDLIDDEAQNLGRLQTRLARALRDEPGAEFVITLVLGLGIAHFHQHLLPRMPGTARNLPWDKSDEVLPRAGPDEVAAFAKRLKHRLERQPA